MHNRDYPYTSPGWISCEDTPAMLSLYMMQACDVTTCFNWPYSQLKHLWLANPSRAGWEVGGACCPWHYALTWKCMAHSEMISSSLPQCQASRSHVKFCMKVWRYWSCLCSCVRDICSRKRIYIAYGSPKQSYHGEGIKSCIFEAPHHLIFGAISLGRMGDHFQEKIELVTLYLSCSDQRLL